VDRVAADAGAAAGTRPRYADGGLVFEVAEGDAVAAVRSQLVGDYNASNLLSSSAACARWACRWPTRRRRWAA